MSDLHVKSTTLNQAQAAFNSAAGRLAPVARAVQGIDDEVVGTNELESMLGDANHQVAVRLQIIGQALSELAAHTGQANEAYGETDRALSRSIEGPQ
jgi:hypothetical protein